MSQNSRILDYMIAHGSISPLEAMNELGVMRLGARIFELKEQAHPIETVMVEGTNRFGETTRYARYYYQGKR